MHTTLYLTSDEQKLFQALPADMREGWTVKEPEIICHEEPEDLIARMKILSPEGREFAAFAKKAQHAKTAQDIDTLAAEFPVESLSYEQMIDTYSLLGTKVLGGIIRHLLQTAQADDDVEAAMTVSSIRNALFKANHSLSA